MRMWGGTVLWMVATVLGLAAAAGLKDAGVAWSGGALARASTVQGLVISMMSMLGLVIWIVLLGLSSRVFRGGEEPVSTNVRVTSFVLMWLSVIAVVLACIVSVGGPEAAGDGSAAMR